LTGIQIQHDDHNSVDLVLDRSIRTYPQRIPFSTIVFHLSFVNFKGIDDLGNGFPEVLDFQIRFDIGDRPANVGWNEVHDLLRHGRETPDTEVITEHDDRYIHAAEQIVQVIVQYGKFIIPV